MILSLCRTLNFISLKIIEIKFSTENNSKSTCRLSGESGQASLKACCSNSSWHPFELKDENDMVLSVKEV